MPQDVPSPIDLRKSADARRWADQAMVLRPERHDVFNCIVQQLRAAATSALTVLELGSGPGFLVERVTSALPEVCYTALDYSEAMHALARERLGVRADLVKFVVQDFRDDRWTHSVTTFDCVLTMQAAHEVRHKQHIPALYAQIRNVLCPDGAFLMCDHYAGPGAMGNRELFMTLDEHELVLVEAGFKAVRLLMKIGTLALYRASRA
jgi:SAM-dependent methyltransferase